MQVKDEQYWQVFQVFVRDKGNPGMKKLLEIFISWSEAVQDQGLSEYNTVLRDLEAFPFLSAMDIGELFVMAVQFWPNGEDFVDLLSPLERKVTTENLTVKLRAQADQARKAGERADSGADVLG